MICRNCMRAVARTKQTQFLPSQYPRFLSGSAASQNATPIDPNTSTQTTPKSPPAATSTSAAQPFPEPLTSAPKKESPAKGKTHAIIKSSMPAGTPLKGLNFLKNKSDPVAMEDHEYPSWLWDILRKREKKAEDGAAGDLFSKSKKQRRLAAKRLRKEQLANPELLIPKVPIYEQTIDLPAGDGTLEGAAKAAGARVELTKAMRNKRRADIKEGNFLKTMR